MGNALSGEGLEGGRNVGRQQAVTEGKARRRGLPPNSVRSTPDDWPFIEVGAALEPSWVLHPMVCSLPLPAARCCHTVCLVQPAAWRLSLAALHVPRLCPSPSPSPRQESLTKLLLFNNLDRGAQRKVVREMYERPIAAGEILIQEGDTGAAAGGARQAACS